jgi:hydroxyacylglutathione hydrolase
MGASRACLADNYAYLLAEDGASARAAIVDPSEAGPVLAALSQAGLSPIAILCTHHHPDHVGGNLEILSRFPGLPVYGHLSDQKRGRIPGQTHGLSDGEEADVRSLDVRSLRWRTMHIPGHTTGAVAYHFAGKGVVFTGDTLFGAGCGRLFEGTPPMMHASLQSLSALPPQTQVYCGHEYTQKNLLFAAAVEPDSQAIAERRERVAAARAAGRPSVPSTIAEERESNPFLRTGEAAVRLAASRAEPSLPTDADGAEIFGALRRWKDRF